LLAVSDNLKRKLPYKEECTGNVRAGEACKRGGTMLILGMPGKKQPH
jgi:hypothetical protein